MPDTLGNARVADELRSFRDRLAQIITDKRALAREEAELRTEISSRGLNPKILAGLARQSLETARETAKRQDFEAQRELYAATLGMSEEPLSDRARARMLPPEPADTGNDDAPLAPPQTGLGPTVEDLADAHGAGQEAFTAGIKITSNPYPAGDPRRRAWDEGWCAAAGSDGMDIPAHLRRPDKPKKPKPDDAPDAPTPEAPAAGTGDDDPGDAPDGDDA